MSTSRIRNRLLRAVSLLAVGAAADTSAPADATMVDPTLVDDEPEAANGANSDSSNGDSKPLKNNDVDSPAVAAARLKSFDPKSPSVLILGGTGVRSHPTTEMFLRKRYKITLLNRGKPYWDAPQRLNSKVFRHWKCDRELRLHQCKGMTEWIKESLTENFDLCIDFSSRKWIDFENLWQTMKGRCDFYIFAGSISVYDVSGGLPKQKLIDRHGLKENMARRPTKSMAPTERYALLQEYPDADNFLKIEEALEHNFSKNSGWPYAVLRTGNVIGAREAEIRQWFAQVWVHGHLHLGMPLHITSNDKISFSYNYDIAQAVFKVFSLFRSEDEEESLSVQNEAFNIACEERFTQYQWFHAVSDAVGLNKIETTGFPVPENFNMTGMLRLYPQNKDGHTVSIQKAVKVLKFAPTALSKAIRETAIFYEKAMTGDVFKNQRRIVMHKIAKVMGGDTSLTAYVSKKYDDIGHKYDEYEDADYEEELDEKFARLEL